MVEGINKTILIIDDELSVREMLEQLVTDNGFNAIAAEDGSNIDDIFRKQQIDLALIDLKLGHDSGHDLTKHITKKYKTPIIIITGTGDEVDTILSLEFGADDYILKPFNPRELLARIKAVLRRSSNYIEEDASKLHEDHIEKEGAKIDFSISPANSPLKQIHHFGNFILNVHERSLIKSELNKDGELSKTEIPLTNSEYKVLEYFLTNPNQIIERPKLLDHLGIMTDYYSDRSIDVIILRLRRKIETSPSKPLYLQTRRNKGYIFVNNKLDNLEKV